MSPKTGAAAYAAAADAPVLAHHGRPWTLNGTPGGTVIPPALAESVLARRKPMLLFRLSAVFLLRFAERAFSGLLFQEPPRSTRRQGAVQASGAIGRIEPPAPEDRMAQAPGVGMLRMRHPGADAASTSSSRASPRASGLAGRAGGCGNAPHVVLRQAAPPGVTSTKPRNSPAARMARTKVLRGCSFSRRPAR